MRRMKENVSEYSVKKSKMGKVGEPEASYVVDERGKRKAVIIPLDKYERLMEDLADLSAVAVRKREKTIPWTEVKKRLKRDGLVLSFNSSPLPNENCESYRRPKSSE